MRQNEGKWALTILGVILLAYILPYTILTNVTKWYGSFFVWILLTIIVIIINFFFAKDWGKDA